MCFIAVANITTTVNKGRQDGPMSGLFLYMSMDMSLHLWLAVELLGFANCRTALIVVVGGHDGDRIVTAFGGDKFFKTTKLLQVRKKAF